MLLQNRVGPGGAKRHKKRSVAYLGLTPTEVDRVNRDIRAWEQAVAKFGMRPMIDGI